MKKIIILTLSTLLTLIYAKEINYTQAESIAKNFMQKLGKKSVEIAPQKAYFSAKLIGTKVGKVQGANNKPYYLFNLKGGGWVIVSDDDINSKIIAYSEKGSIDLNNLPPQFKWWIDTVSDELNKAKKLYKNKKYIKPNFKQVEKAYAAPIAVKSSVGPLLKTNWGQGSGYNEKCPYDPRSIEGNNHVPAGCVAVAMAQVMNYFSWPPKGEGAVSYIPPSNPQYGRQSVDFSNTSYNWGNIDKRKLIYHSGVAVRMDYTPYGSGSFLSSASDALRNNFKYSTSGLTQKTSDTQWESMLINSLSQGYPVLYQGKGNIVHVFVCDGYKRVDDGYMFHFNWGWNGRGNGWFKIGGLTPISDYSFNSKNYAIFNIHPNDPSYKLGMKEMKASNLLSLPFLLFIFIFGAYRGLKE